MKFTCYKTNLMRGVNTVLKAVPTKTTMKILECILIDCSTDIIKLTANDMELGIETTIDGSIIETGVIAIDAKLLSEIVRKLPDNEVIIETNENYEVSIICEKAKFNIGGKSGADFSYLPYIEKDMYVSLSEFSLKEVIRQTIFSIADNNSDILMTGELFDIADGILKVVSLDGHRISLRKIELEDNKISQKVVVPGKTLQEVSKILTGETTKEVKLYFTSSHIVFEFENTVVVSRLIEGNYFQVSRMMSHDYKTKVTINKKELLSCIDRAILLVKEGDKKPIIVNITDKKMELKIFSQIGRLDEEILIKKEGDDLMIGFNPKLLLDALRVIDEEEISIYLLNSKAPCFIKDDKDTYTYLILPVNFAVS